jgi:hypothetical protein
MAIQSTGTDREWLVRVRLSEAGRAVTAVAELVDDYGGTLSASGVYDTDFADHEPESARRELATARALRRLADLLVTSATQELSMLET